MLGVTNLDVYIDTSTTNYQCSISARLGVQISSNSVAIALTAIIVQLVEGIV